MAHPDEVEVEEFLDDIGSVYGVRVHGEDIGRVIGKDGRVANALRQVVKAAATKTGAHVTVEIMTDDAPHENARLVFSGCHARPQATRLRFFVCACFILHFMSDSDLSTWDVLVGRVRGHWNKPT